MSSGVESVLCSVEQFLCLVFSGNSQCPLLRFLWHLLGLFAAVEDISHLQ